MAAVEGSVPALKIRNLNKTYAGGTTALQDVNLTVQAGDFFALLGPNGAGKSTLIGILSALVNKTAGHIEIFGYDMDRQLEAAKSCIGVVPQEFNCNGFEKVIDVLICQAGYYGVSGERARRNAGIYLKELGLWDKRNEAVRHLSGGMKRRLMIARALVHEPSLVILDEPTAGVDIEIRRSMWDFMSGLNQDGTTIILTTHYLEEAESLCRNIAIINRGRIVEDTAMRTLLERLHAETFVLYLRRPLRTLPAGGDFALKVIDEHTLEAELNQHQALSELFGWLAERDIEVKSMRNKANRLEQLFMDLVRQNQGLAPGSLPSVVNS